MLQKGRSLHIGLKHVDTAAYQVQGLEFQSSRAVSTMRAPCSSSRRIKGSSLHKR
jgi:hypothetical protein